MTTSRDVLASSPDRCRGQISWDYDRAQIIADGVVHAIGVYLGLIGAVTIVVMAVKIERIDVAPILVYVIGLVTMLAFSAAYNMWPVSPVKWVLRRFDHSAIYLLIDAWNLHAICGADEKRSGLGRSRHRRLVERRLGMALKLALPGRFDRLAVILCLLLGWSGVIATTPSHLPSPARAYGFSRSGAFSIRSARSSMCGGACAFTTPSGTVLC